MSSEVIVYMHLIGSPVAQAKFVYIYTYSYALQYLRGKIVHVPRMSFVSQLMFLLWIFLMGFCWKSNADRPIRSIRIAIDFIIGPVIDSCLNGNENENKNNWPHTFTLFPVKTKVNMRHTPKVRRKKEKKTGDPIEIFSCDFLSTII